MENRKHKIKDVSLDPTYWSKDIDFIITSSISGEVKSFEVKWDYRINGTQNLYLELTNRNSKQWNGEGWWKHCEADYLAYGDAKANKFYVFDMAALRERVEGLPRNVKNCGYDSTGLIVSLNKLADLYIEMPVAFAY